MRQQFLYGLCGLLLLLAAPMRGQGPEQGRFFIQNYDPGTYGAFQQNWAAVQAPNGLLYFGNTFGVLEFDGKRWRLIRLDNGGVARSMAVSPSGRIYVGGQGSFGYLAPGPAGALEYQALNPQLPDSLASSFGYIWETWAIGNRVYFNADKHLFAWDEAEGKAHWWLAANFFHRSQSWQQQLLIMEEGIGLFRLDPQADTLRFLPGSEPFAQSKLYGWTSYRNDTALIASRNRLMLAHIADDTLRVSPFACDCQPILDDTRIYRLLRLRNGNFLVATIGAGVLEVSPQGKLLAWVRSDNGLQDDIALGLLEDAEQGIWVAMNFGISRIGLASPITFFQEKEGLGGGVNTFVRHRGRLLAGTDEGVFALDGGKWESIEALQDLQVWNMMAAPEDEETLLLGTTEGLYAFHEGKGPTQLAPGVCFQLLRHPLNSSRFLYVSEHVLRSGHIGPKGFEADSFRLEFPSEVRSMAVEPGGRLWLATNFSGVATLDPDPNKPGRYAEQFALYDSLPGFSSLKDLYVYWSGARLLLATPKGLMHFDGETFRPFDGYGADLADGRHDVYRMAHGEREVWLTGLEQGTSPMRRILRESNGDRAASALRSPFRELPAMSAECLLLEDAYCWLGGSKGVFRIDKSRLGSEEGHPYAAFIRKITAGESDSLLLEGAWAEGALPERLPYTLNALTFHFAAATFNRPEATEFSYRLANNDHRWSAWSTDAKAHYTNLYEGAYIFEVKARSLLGHESRPARFEVRIAPPPYRQWWAFALYALLAAAAVWGIAKAYARKVRRERDQLEEMVQERTREVRLKHAEVEQQKEEISAQAENLREANLAIMDKNHEIEAQRDRLQEAISKLTSSIGYAQRIQRALHSSEAELQRLLPASFVLLKPRDIVSGDFFWVAAVQGKIVVAAVDCTGHGVPGAFMSTIGNALLKETVLQQGIVRADLILDEVDRALQESLQHQQGRSVQDGMDMALCVLDLEKGEMEFAGAKNPLVRVGPDGVDWIKGDRRPIGGRNLGSKRQPDVPFTLHRMPLAPGCSYYLFSDGFQDQFGGEEGMKFSPKRLRELLASAHGLPIAQQRAFLEEAFEAWKGRERQIDDVMVVGFGVG